MRLFKNECGSQGLCPKAMRSPQRAIASPNGIEIPGMVTGARKGRQSKITTNCNPRPWRISTISRIISGRPCGFTQQASKASEIRSVASAEPATSRMKAAINHGPIWLRKHSWPCSAGAIQPKTIL